MKAVRVHHFGDPGVLRVEDVPQPSPGPGDVLVRVVAAGVGPWDAWVREGRSMVPQTLPFIPGADIAGVIERVGEGVSGLTPGDAVFGATNGQFTGAYAEYAVASAAMVAIKPPQVPFVEAAAVPVVGCTAWQMVFKYGRVDHAKRVLIHGGAGNVGALAVQLARPRAREVIATALLPEVEFVRALGIEQVIDVQAARFEDVVRDIDARTRHRRRRHAGAVLRRDETGWCAGLVSGPSRRKPCRSAPRRGDVLPRGGAIRGADHDRPPDGSRRPPGSRG